MSEEKENTEREGEKERGREGMETGKKDRGERISERGLRRAERR